MVGIGPFDDYPEPMKRTPVQLTLPLPDSEAEERARQSEEQTRQFIFNAEAMRISNSLLGLL